MKVQPMNPTLNLGACSETWCRHNLHKDILRFYLISICEVMWNSGFPIDVDDVCGHGGSPTEPYPEPGRLLKIPMLAQFAPRDLKILIDIHICEMMWNSGL